MKMRKRASFLLLLLIVMSCKNSESIADISFTSVAKGLYSNFQQGRHVIKSVAEWEAALPNLNLPAIDFNREMIIAVLRGEKRSSGYEVAITRVESKGNELIVYVDEHEPGMCNVIFVFTSPFHVIQLQRMDGAVGFEITKKVCQ